MEDINILTEKLKAIDLDDGDALAVILKVGDKTNIILNGTGDALLNICMQAIAGICENAVDECDDQTEHFIDTIITLMTSTLKEHLEEVLKSGSKTDKQS